MIVGLLESWELLVGSGGVFTTRAFSRSDSFGLGVIEDSQSLEPEAITASETFGIGFRDQE